jgi:hypothetical protein
VIFQKPCILRHFVQVVPVKTTRKFHLVLSKCFKRRCCSYIKLSNKAAFNSIVIYQYIILYGQFGGVKWGPEYFEHMLEKMIRLYRDICDWSHMDCHQSNEIVSEHGVDQLCSPKPKPEK